jgi:hypothetical protein
MTEMYQAAAQAFADKVNALFESEATLEAEFKRLYSGLPFDRTEHWAGIIYGLLRDAWLEKGPVVKCDPTGMDRLQIIKHAQPLLDYNLFTQVLLNLQLYTGMHYMTGDAQKELDRIKQDWPKNFTLNPFAPKAKMLKQAEAITEEQKRYNETISTVRALSIITQFTPMISFRVSPKGSTPAFADSRNISMIGMGGDKYLKTTPELKTYYITWDMVPSMAYMKPGDSLPMAPAPGVKPPQTGITFMAPGIPYPFVSKSGGQVLHDVLFARKIMYEIFKGMDITKETCIMIPRMQSVLIVADNYSENLQNAFKHLKEQYPMLTLTEGQRA